MSTRAVVGSPQVALADAVVLVHRGRERGVHGRASSTAGATAGDYEGFIEITGGGQTYTIPYFVRVQDPAVAKDVLLIDWDRNLGADYRPVVRSGADRPRPQLRRLRRRHVCAANGNPGPTFAQLQNYRAVVLFTGNNTVELGERARRTARSRSRTTSSRAASS